MDMTPKPGPEHAWLARHAGKWSAKISTTFMPGAPAMEWTGEMNIQMTGGGLWQVLDFTGVMGKTPYSGHGVTGFDMFQKKYVHCWVDSMSPMMIHSRGSVDTANNTMTLETDPSPHAPRMKTSTREVNDRELIFTIDIAGPDGAMFTVMKAYYTRK